LDANARTIQERGWCQVTNNQTDYKEPIMPECPNNGAEMVPNEAIRNLKKGKCIPHKRETLKLAIKALQKQIPKHPTIEGGFVKCPECEKYIRFPIADKYNNCPECGQTLKWWGEEE